MTQKHFHHRILVVLSQNTVKNEHIRKQVRALPYHVHSEITLVLILPEIPSYYTHVPALLDLEAGTIDKARQFLTEFATHFDIPEERQWVRFGNAAHIVPLLAHEGAFDTVIRHRQTERSLATFFYTEGKYASTFITYR